MRKPDRLPPSAIVVARALAQCVGHLRAGERFEAGMWLQIAKVAKWKIPDGSRCSSRAWTLVTAVEMAARGCSLEEVD